MNTGRDDLVMRSIVRRALSALLSCYCGVLPNLAANTVIGLMRSRAAGMIATMVQGKHGRRVTNSQASLVQSIGRNVSRFQESSNAFDDVAAEILALDRRDLACMTMLLFNGAASADELAAALPMPRGIVTTTLERLQLAGY